MKATLVHGLLIRFGVPVFRFVAIAVIGHLGAEGCSAEVDRDTRSASTERIGRYAAFGTPMEEPFVRGMMPDDWIGYELDLDLPLVYDLQPTLSEQANGGPTLADLAAISGVTAEHDGAMVAFYRGGIYLVEVQLSEELSGLVHERLDGALRTLPAGSFQEPLVGHEPDTVIPPATPVKDAPHVAPASRIGTDVRKSLDSRMWIYRAGATPYDAIGSFVSVADSTDEHITLFATASLISERDVLTAAHNLVRDSGDGLTFVYNHLDFVPRANKQALPFGRWSMGGQQASTSTLILVPMTYVMHLCFSIDLPGIGGPLTGDALARSIDCAPSDWAVIRYAPEVLQRTGIYMSYTVSHDPFLNLKNRGYPSCTHGDYPPNCDPGLLYGALHADEKCNAKILEANPAMGAHDCDTNFGHSGGPVYEYASVGFPRIVGVHTGDCGGYQECFPTGSWNRMVRVTESMAGAIDVFVTAP